MSSKKRFSMIVAVHLFLINDQNQVLLARRYQTGWGDGLLSVPAGHVDGGETVKTALIREALEEIGLSLSPDQVEFVHVMHRQSDTERIDFFFACRHWTGTPIIGEPDKCDLLTWADLDQLPETMVPYVKTTLTAYINHHSFSEYGWEPTL